MIELGEWYVVLDPSWIDSKGRRSVQQGLMRGMVVQALKVDADGDVEVYMPQAPGQVDDRLAIVAAKHLERYVKPVVAIQQDRLF